MAFFVCLYCLCLSSQQGQVYSRVEPPRLFVAYESMLGQPDAGHVRNLTLLKPCRVYNATKTMKH